MQHSILITDRPAAAACSGNCRKDEGSPKTQRQAAQVRSRRAEARQLDRIVARQACDTLTDERVGRDDSEELAVAAQAVRPTARRTADLTHSMTP